jgi:chaperonin GroEL
VTIQEINGPSGYEVERIDGYPMPMGYEDSCMKFASKFINDPGNQRTVMENPVFVVYHGRITEIQTLVFLLEKVGQAWQSDEGFRHNIVLVATGFSESVIANLAVNFAEATTINVFPLLAPLTGTPNSQLGFLQDMCAYTGSQLFDPLNNPLDKAELDALGYSAKTFEVNRFRSMIVGDEDDVDAADRINKQVEILKQQQKQCASIQDSVQLEERIGKLTGGIAKLKVIGASNGDLRERRDRVEDAVCAVRGAMNEGFLPGGGWTLLLLAAKLREKDDPVYTKILAPALEVPVRRILTNCGLLQNEAEKIMDECLGKGAYNARDQKFVEPFTGGLYDSTPAVRNAIRNSLSIAKLLGLLGGTSVFKRDLTLERKEASDTNSFLRDANYSENPANERAL